MPGKEHVGALRLIPAHAGKTRTRTLSISASRAHPRSRGENCLFSRRAGGHHGSSPLTRGKHCGGYWRAGCCRLIPAHAGKTGRTSAPARPSAAHPRSRGENCSMSKTNADLAGSSPLTRGKRRLLIGHGKRLGLIPAHAGKTRRSRRARRGRRAHPRSRGENNVVLTSPRTGKGSSPLTRGKHFLTCAFTAQIDQILESLELCASSENYSSQDAYATDAP